MGQTAATRQSDNITPPRENTVRVVVAGAAAIAVSLVEFADRFITITNDGLPNLYLVFGVAGTVVADPAAVAGATRCQVIPPNQSRSYRLRVAVDNFMSVVTTGAATTVRYAPSSEPEGFALGTAGTGGP